MNLVSWLGIAVFAFGVSRFAAPWLWHCKRPIAAWVLAIAGAGGVLLGAAGLVLNMLLGGTDSGWNVLDDPEKVLPDRLYIAGAGFIALGLGVLLLTGRQDRDAAPDFSRRTIGRLDSWS